MRQPVQMDICSLWPHYFHTAIELTGTAAKPPVDVGLGSNRQTGVRPFFRKASVFDLKTTTDSSMAVPPVNRTSNEKHL
jgi:hypothetical protein